MKALREIVPIKETYRRAATHLAIAAGAGGLMLGPVGMVAAPAAYIMGGGWDKDFKHDPTTDKKPEGKKRWQDFKARFWGTKENAAYSKSKTPGEGRNE